MEIRKSVIETIRRGFVNDERVYALWLEGADGLGRADEYSDLEVWFDVEDGYEEEILNKCGAILSQNGNLDYVDYFEHLHPKIFQRHFHIENTPEFLIIDASSQSHSRGSVGCTFFQDDIAVFPLILFDKAEIVRILPPERIASSELKPIFDRYVNKFRQRPRLLKFINRRRFIEANYYFDEFVRQPIVTLFRLIYTPRHYEYGFVHISEHLPKNIVLELEELYKVNCLEDIINRIDRADELFYEAYNALKEILK